MCVFYDNKYIRLRWIVIIVVYNVYDIIYIYCRDALCNVLIYFNEANSDSLLNKLVYRSPVYVIKSKSIFNKKKKK